MKLLKLGLKNFQGIRDFTLEPNGNNISIFGDNGTGKTTLYSAFLWLLFDKDSQNKKDFSLKTLDLNGQEIHNLDHEVVGVFEINGQKLTLRKVYAEKWTKKRGSAQTAFTGHTTTYYIDDVPAQKSEYTDRISQIVNEDIFKLLTSPSYFNDQLHWQDRRKILLEVCGDLTDSEVISSEKSLSELPDILQGRKLDDHKKVITARRTEINKELDRLPVRIDEANRSLPDITSIDSGIIPSKIADLKSRVQTKNEQIARIQNGGEVAEKTKALREAEGRMLDIKNQHRAKAEEKVQGKRERLVKLNDKVSSQRQSVRDMERTVTLNAKDIVELENKMTDLREEWRRVNDQQFEFAQETVCPTCGQDLPTEKLTTAREKAFADFNRTKAEKLEKITAEGKKQKAKNDQLWTENVKLTNEIKTEREALKEIENEAATLREDVEAAVINAIDIDSVPEYTQARREKESLEAIIAELKSGNDGQVVGIKAEVAMLESEIGELEKLLAQVDQAKKGEKRIKELEKQQKELAAEYEKLEKELYLTEEFIRTKVRMLDDRINSRFKMARFKLFDVQVNGALNEVCEVTYLGVPYGGGLNNGHRIIVGMDIIRTLSEHYGFVAPIFVDNAESVTTLPEMDCQIVRLIKPDMNPPASEDISPEKHQQLCDQLRKKYSKLVVEIESGANKENIIKEAV